MVVLGGSGSITGSVLAAVLPDPPAGDRPHRAGRRREPFRMLLYALLLIVLMLTRPAGALRRDGRSP